MSAYQFHYHHSHYTITPSLFHSRLKTFIFHRPKSFRWLLDCSSAFLAQRFFFCFSFFSSFHWNELMQSRGFRRPSVCLSVNFFAQIATTTTHMTRSRPNLHTMVPRRARIQDVLKVKVKGYVIRALLWCHEMFAIQYHLLTFCLCMHSLYEPPLQVPMQYKCQTARCNVYITEWATPSLTVWFLFSFLLFFSVFFSYRLPSLSLPGCFLVNRTHPRRFIFSSFINFSSYALD